LFAILFVYKIEQYIVIYSLLHGSSLQLKPLTEAIIKSFD